MASRPPHPADALLAAEAPLLRAGAWRAALAAALWPVQAGCIAWAVAGWIGAEPAPLTAPLAAALVFLLIALIRAGLDRSAAGRMHRAADAVIARERDALLRREARAKGPQSAAAIAALIAQKLPLLRPWITRYRAAEVKVRLLPPLLLLLVLPISWAVALILAVAGPLIPVFMALVGMAAEDASRRQMAEIGSMNSMLADRLGALLDMRLLGGAARAERAFDAAADSLRARTMAVLKIAFLSSTVLELFSALGVALVAVYVGFSLLGEIGIGAWGAPLSVAEGVFLLLIAPDFFQPLRELAAAWHDRAAGRAVAEELSTLAAAPRRGMIGRGAPAAPLPGALSLRLRDAVADLGGATLPLPDLTLSAGEAIALTGPSGVGKTTVLEAAAGLLPLASGGIETCGRPLGPDTADSWRARIAFLPQRLHFGDAPLGELLDLRRSGADPDPFLRLAHAHTIVESIPGGLSARLGETGGGVSGGEARRLMLARAAMAGGDLLLADEPTADLDPTTAAQVIDALLALRAQGRALLIATHDPALAAAMDRTIALPADFPEAAS